LLLPLAAKPTPSSPGTGPLVDAQGRRITYLRMSVTDRCNFRCVYCSPSNWAGKADYLSGPELIRLASVFVSMGVERIRLTGGEPLIRDDLPAIARGIAAIAGVRELCLTTNGHRLAALAGELVAAGISNVNVSLDAVDAAGFRALTKNGDVARVLTGIEAARNAGFSRIGVNAVVMPGKNDAAAQLAALARFAWSHGAVPRYIELMPFAGAGEVVPSAEVRKRLESQGIRLTQGSARDGAGPAGYWTGHDPEGPGGDVGFIGAMTENFCTRCNRVRLTATGELRACLGGREQVPLAPMLRAGADDAALAAAIRGALLAKWEGHRFVDDGPRGLLPMMGIGG
jgi:cyclic pyranopterin phosphate synthase